MAELVLLELLLLVLELVLLLLVVLDEIEMEPLLIGMAPYKAAKNAESISPVCGSPLFCWKSITRSTIVLL